MFFGWWEEAGAHRENLLIHEENMQTPHRKAPAKILTNNRLLWGDGANPHTIVQPSIIIQFIKFHISPIHTEPIKKISLAKEFCTKTSLWSNSLSWPCTRRLWNSRVWSTRGVSDIFRILQESSKLSWRFGRFSLTPVCFQPYILKSNYYWGHIFLPFGRAHRDL